MVGILSNVDIRNAIASGDIVFDPPLAPEQIRTSGVKLRLSDAAWKTRLGRLHLVDLSEPSSALEITPKEFVQFTTYESVRLLERLSARMTLMRQHAKRGLVLFSNGQLRPGCNGRPIVSVFNSGDESIFIKHRALVCSLEIFEVAAPLGASAPSLGEYTSILKGGQTLPLVDFNTSIKILENVPHERQELDDETMEWMQKFFERMAAEEPDDTIPKDLSENLDKYLYDPDFKKL